MIERQFETFDPGLQTPARGREAGLPFCQLFQDLLSPKESHLDVAAQEAQTTKVNWFFIKRKRLRQNPSGGAPLSVTLGKIFMPLMKYIKTSMLIGINVLAMTAFIGLLLKYGHIPPPLASPDEFRFDFLAIPLFGLALSCIAVDLIALITVFVSSHNKEDKAKVNKILVRLIFSWITASMVGFQFVG